MRPRGMTDEAIRQAQEEVRCESGALLRKPEVEAAAERLRITVEEIKAEWHRKAAQGDQRARDLLCQCYPEEMEALDAAAAVLTARPPRPFNETDRDEEEAA